MIRENDEQLIPGSCFHSSASQAQILVTILLCQPVNLGLALQKSDSRSRKSSMKTNQMNHAFAKA
jgi:hypothetical protein